MIPTPFGSAITRDAVIVFDGTSKQRLFQVLAETAAAQFPQVSPSQVAEKLWDRESLLSTRLGLHVAMPHANLPDAGDTAFVIALCPDGIEYDAHRDDPVHIAVCVVGPESQHLEALSMAATALQLPGLLDELVAAARGSDADTAFSLIESRAGARVSEAAAAERSNRSEQVWLHALNLAPMVGARCILLHAPASEAVRYPAPEGTPEELFVLTPEELGVPASSVSNLAPTDTSSLSVALLYAITEERIRQDEIIVNVFGARDTAVLDTIQVIDVQATFSLFLSVSRELAVETATHRVMLRALDLAAELAAEGREGKPVGALFVIGDFEAVRPHCHQMLMNPFKGYEPQQRNILDPGLAETVKELSRIDGAFVITDDGVIESAGTYLRVDTDVEELPSGLGARHTAAASITAVSEAVAIAISESTRQVSIFRHGRRVVVL